MSLLIDVKGLRIRYPAARTDAVKSLSFQLQKGEILGLLGPNGAGKSSTIAVLTTLLRPQAGKITIADIDIVRHPQKVRAYFGLVPQEIALYPTLSLEENLRYFASLHNLSGADLARSIDKYLELVGLSDHRRQRVETFSGGMKRRANLAVGIIHSPQLLFLDEPTVGIDTHSRHTILENLQLLQQQGMSMVYTSHYMEEVEQLCSQILIMDGGKILAQGHPEKLLAQEQDCANLEQLFLKRTGRRLRD